MDAGAQKAGQTIKDTKLTKEGTSFHVTTGPASAYWDPANKATGNYTVYATFSEPKYMNLNTHPHPYGIMIAGDDLGTRSKAISTARPMEMANSSCVVSAPIHFR